MAGAGIFKSVRGGSLKGVTRENIVAEGVRRGGMAVALIRIRSFNLDLRNLKINNFQKKIV